MKYNSSYLVCRDYIQEVERFLSQFFIKEKNRYNHKGWITFTLPDSDFRISLMKGNDQAITQNMTFEITCETLEQLENFAKKHHKDIGDFVATETGNPYRYHYIEIHGPNNICKMEVNYIEEGVA